MELVVYSVAFAGMTCLSAATEHLEALRRHGRRVQPHARVKPERRRLLRGGGALLLLLSATAAVEEQGWAFGLVEWFGALSVAAIAVTFLLPYRPHWPVYISGLAIAASAVSILVTALS